MRSSTPAAASYSHKTRSCTGAAAAVGAGVLVAMLGVTTYPTMFVGQLLLWSVGPAVILAGIAVVLAGLIRDGHTSALRWQIWLRMPNLTVALATIGLLLIHVDLYARQNWPTVLANLSIGRNSTGSARSRSLSPSWRCCYAAPSSKSSSHRSSSP